MLKQEEILEEEDTEVDINNRHMDRIRASMLVIIRYVIFHSTPQAFTSLRLTSLGAIAPRRPRTTLICSNNPKLLLLLPLLLLELHPPRDRMLGLNTPLTGLHTVTTSMIPNVSYLLFESS